MKAIVTTTINPPGEALLRYSSLRDWTLIVAGDLATPHGEYSDLDCIYLSPDDQAKKYPELSQLLGWQTITRRNVGFLEAYLRGAEIVATVDDDNIPSDEWGEDLVVGQKLPVACYDSTLPVLDPLAVAPHDGQDLIWHRGFPHEYVPKRKQFTGPRTKECTIHVQASLWNGEPDVDAICRMIYQPSIVFRDFVPFTTSSLVPFNSQNCFLTRAALPYYMMLTHVGRAQDVLGAYVLQHFLPNCVVFSPPTVTHVRNEHDVCDDLENELQQYRITKKLVDNIDRWREILPRQTVMDFDLYRTCFEE